MNLGQTIREKAAHYALDPLLIAAIILVESEQDPFAFRYENQFFNTYIRGKKREDLGGTWPCCDTHSLEDMEERKLRACSFGLMQLMGQVARELGFKGLYLRELWEPNINIELGCKKLARDLVRIRSKNPAVVGVVLTRKLLLKWNGGADTNYPDRVFRNIDNGRAARVLV